VAPLSDSSDSSDSVDIRIQTARLDKITKLLRSDELCLGAALVGSFAKGTADRVSDLDLILYAEDMNVEVLADRLREFLAEDEIFWSFSGRHDAVSVFTKTIFLDFTSAEFSVVGTSTGRFRLRRPFLELVNKENVLASLVSDLPTIDKASFPVYANGEQGLTWELFSYLKRLRRAQISSVKEDVLRLAAEIARTAT